jgi:hypothetical protein
VFAIDPSAHKTNQFGAAALEDRFTQSHEESKLEAVIMLSVTSGEKVKNKEERKRIGDIFGCTITQGTPSGILALNH